MRDKPIHTMPARLLGRGMRAKCAAVARCSASVPAMVNTRGCVMGCQREPAQQCGPTAAKRGAPAHASRPVGPPVPPGNMELAVSTSEEEGGRSAGQLAVHNSARLASTMSLVES